MLKAGDYFDLAGFTHGDILNDLEHVWDALKTIKDYIAACTAFEIKTRIPAGAWIENAESISIGEGTVVENGATIIGPALIGRNCEIRQGAYIRGNLIAGDGCVIGHTTEVKNSIFLNGAKAPHFAYVGDSILGRNVNLGAGTKLANFKVDTGDRYISVEIDGVRLETGLRKMGAILGDCVEIGCNSVTMPGTLVAPRTIVYPCSVLRGTIPADRVVKTRWNHEISERRGNKNVR